MDPRLYLLIAKALEKFAAPAAECRRSAINRAYYGAYGVAHQALIVLECPIPQSAAGHDAVQIVLQLSGDPALEQAGRLLHHLYTWRVKADYRYTNTLPEEARTVKDALGLAAKIIANVDGAMVDTPKARLAVHAALAAMLLRPFSP